MTGKIENRSSYCHVYPYLSPARNIIRRRYKTGITNLVSKYIPICDYWMIVNNSEGPFYLIAEGLKDCEIEIKDLSVWNKIKTQGNE